VGLFRSAVALLIVGVIAAAGCSGARQTAATSPTTTGVSPRTTQMPPPVAPTATTRVRHRKPSPLPGDLLIADRDNNRVLIVTPSKRIAWMAGGLHGPDDAFFTPSGRSIITNEEFHDTLAEVSLRTKRAVWSYGHGGVAGSSPGYLNTPDDAYRLANGHTVIADIRNCRIVELTHSKRVARILGGSCNHDPPRGFASPNGDTPLADGGLLVTEIGGWIDRLDARGRLSWSVRSPIAYPSDAQLLPDGKVLVVGFTIPGKIVILDRRGRVRWSFGAASGRNMLAKPSLAIRLPNGMIAANDDYNHRVIVIDPHSKRIVWQYGHTGVPGSSRGYLNKPDGIDLAPVGFRLPG
jgi:outer membrane protein assembly factor BamB